jgi:hypothetical protein
MCDAADRVLIQEVIQLHGHLVDEGCWDDLARVFSADVVYDLCAFGGGQLIGPEAIVQAGLALGQRNPLAHHVTNVVVTQVLDDAAQARSKGLAVFEDGTAASVLYEDQLRRTGGGWRITHRRVLPRRQPVHPSGAAS